MTATIGRIEATRAHLKDHQGKLSTIVEELLGERAAAEQRVIARMASSVFTLVYAALDVVGETRRNVDEIANQHELTEQARQERIADTVAGARTEATETLDSAMSEAERLVTRLEGRIGISRPEGDRIEQEATLSNLRSDVLMVLDGLPNDQVVNEAIGLLEHYVAAKNGLAVWLMAAPASDFMPLFLRRYGVGVQHSYQMRTDAAVDPIMPADAKGAREVYDAMTGPNGLAYVVDLAGPAIDAALSQIEAAPLSTPDPAVPVGTPLRSAGR